MKVEIAIRPRLLALLKTHTAGLTSNEAQRILGVSANGVNRQVRALGEAGAIALMRHSYVNVMCLPEHAPAVRARLRAESEDKASRDKLRKAAWNRKHLTGLDETPMEDEAPPIHRWVSMSMATPIKPKGPASVWEWGTK